MYRLLLGFPPAHFLFIVPPSNIDDLGKLVVNLLESDARLSAKDGSIVVTTSGDHICLLRELLAAMAPECLNFVTASMLPEESQESLPLTCESSNEFLWDFRPPLLFLQGIM